jgi:adenylylsulfate kinase
MGSTDIFVHPVTISRDMRTKFNKHKSVVIWFTGLSGSGKSTLAHAIEAELFNRGCKTFVLDGDNVRNGLCADLDFSKEGRKENIRRIGHVSKLMVEAGIIVITAFISPFQHDRDVVRNMLKHGDFIEIYCNASLLDCEAKDVKGMYKRAKDGKIKNFTGVDSSYEEPKNPDLNIDIYNTTLNDSVVKIINFIEDKKILIL